MLEYFSIIALVITWILVLVYGLSWLWSSRREPIIDISLDEIPSFQSPDDVTRLSIQNRDLRMFKFEAIVVEVSCFDFAMVLPLEDTWINPSETQTYLLKIPTLPIGRHQIIITIGLVYGFFPKRHFYYYYSDDLIVEDIYNENSQANLESE